MAKNWQNQILGSTREFITSVRTKAAEHANLVFVDRLFELSYIYDIDIKSPLCMPEEAGVFVSA